MKHPEVRIAAAPSLVPLLIFPPSSIQEFPKTLYALQICDTAIYLIVGIVVYAYTGIHAVSPALGNTGVTLRKIAYGIALPTIMIAGVINGHVCAKLIYVRLCVF